MPNKITIALSLALSIGAASTALADFEYDATGAPINMHLVGHRDTPGGAFAATDAFASTRAPSRVWAPRAGTDPDPFIRLQLRREQQWRTGG